LKKDNQVTRKVENGESLTKQQKNESNFSKIKVNRDLKKLSPKQRLDMMLRLMEFVVPKLRVEEFKNEIVTVQNHYQRFMDKVLNNCQNEEFEKSHSEKHL